jgi:G6PDH family F420-dependent oxidoreductase
VQAGHAWIVDRSSGPETFGFAGWWNHIVMRIGYALSSEEHGPRELVDQARRAQAAGFEALWISDHYHPWNDEQGQSPFVWATIGALSQAVSIPVTTAVTCPILRIHPAVVAQAAATCAVLHEGRFVLGVGTGEALNEHILGDPWPETDVRLEMLEEAVMVMRRLWDGGVVSHRGTHFRVQDARLYTLPAERPQVYVSGFGSKSQATAGRIGDGYMTTKPDKDGIARFRAGGGAGKPVQAQLKVCWDGDRDRAVATVHRLWPNELLPGQLAQELPYPSLFEQASELVTKEMVRESPTPMGPDVDEHVQAIRTYLDAGCDEVYVGQIGPEHDEFFRAYEQDVLPAVRAA